MKLRASFDAHFISCFAGARKCCDLFWEHVVSDFERTPDRTRPDEIAFFDDSQDNIETALSFGVEAMLFTTVPTFKEQMARLETGGRPGIA